MMMGRLYFYPLQVVATIYILNAWSFLLDDDDDDDDVGSGWRLG